MNTAARAPDLPAILDAAVRAVEAEGALLHAEFVRPQGPRGERSKAPIDDEIENRLCGALQSLLPCAFVGEETGETAGTLEGWRWLVDPQDGTSEFLKGNRGSAISVALLREGDPVMGIVHCPCPPDRDADTIAWAEGAGPVRRNGVPVASQLAERTLAAGSFVYATKSSESRPEVFARGVAPARFLALPSIAYRLARVAAGDAVATLSVHPVNEYDIAAGAALIRAAGGVLLDGEGREIVFTGTGNARVSGCYAGAPKAAEMLAAIDWQGIVERTPRREPRIAPAFPKIADGAQLGRAQACLLGQASGDALGSLVEFRRGREVRHDYPHGVRELAGGGTWHTIAGQPTDDTELALALARSIVRERRFDAQAVLATYRVWLDSQPFDCGATIRAGLDGRPETASQSNGALMRCAPIGIWAAGDAARAARVGAEDAALTHPNPVCLQASAAFAAAVAVGIGGGSRNAMVEAALAHSDGAARAALEAGVKGNAPADFETRPGWVLVALQNAFFMLMRAEGLEDALADTIARGGDTDTNAAIAGALLGAAYGRDAIPVRWQRTLLGCRALSEVGARHPRPAEYWPDDIPDLAELLLQTGSFQERA